MENTIIGIHINVLIVIGHVRLVQNLQVWIVFNVEQLFILKQMLLKLDIRKMVYAESPAKLVPMHLKMI